MCCGVAVGGLPVFVGCLGLIWYWVWWLWLVVVRLPTAVCFVRVLLECLGID